MVQPNTEQILQDVWDSNMHQLRVDSSPVVLETTDVISTDVPVDGTVGGVQLLAANASRKIVVVQNTGQANMRVTFDGTPPTATHGWQIYPGMVVARSMPFLPTRDVLAIRESGVSTTAFVEEVT